MIIDPKYKIREIAGEQVIVNQGTSNVNMTKIIALNFTAVALFEELSGKDFSVGDAADFLVNTYGIDADRAATDAAAWVKAMKDCGIIG